MSGLLHADAGKTLLISDSPDLVTFIASQFKGAPSRLCIISRTLSKSALGLPAAVKFISSTTKDDATIDGRRAGLAQVLSRLDDPYHNIIFHCHESFIEAPLASRSADAWIGQILPCFGEVFALFKHVWAASEDSRPTNVCLVAPVNALGSGRLGGHGAWGRGAGPSKICIAYGLAALCRTMAREGERLQVRVNALFPEFPQFQYASGTPSALPVALLPGLGVLLGELALTDAASGQAFCFSEASVCRAGWQRSSGALVAPAADPTTKAHPTPQSFLNPAYSPIPLGDLHRRWTDVVSFNAESAFPETITEVDWIGHLEDAQDLPQPKPLAKLDLSLRGQVALVTGAGAGLGRFHALELARHGAAVVVNDMNLDAARKVVAEIVSLGGRAVPDGNPVNTAGHLCVETAIRNFGRIDIVVNNAGILRDRSFARMTEQEWDAVMMVHLAGTIAVTAAAWPHFMHQRHGRVFNTSSSVGLYGNFGQANYSTAKAAIHGFTDMLACQGRDYNITANTLCPNAGTAMTATILPEDMVARLSPAYVSPILALLSVSACQVTGGCFEAGSGWFARVRRVFTQPVALSARGNPGIIQSILDMDLSASADDPQGQVHEPIIKRLLSEDASATAGRGSDFVDILWSRRFRSPKAEFLFSERDVALYALGVGATSQDLSVVYEQHDYFHCLPTFPVVCAFNLLASMNLSQHLPKFDLARLLHGEQRIEIYDTLPTSGALSCQAYIIDIQDKGKGALVITGVDTFDESGRLIFFNEFAVFIRGAGNFSRRDSALSLPIRPAPAVGPAAPSKYLVQVAAPTGPSQAALYRLASGDLNPLHISPDFAEIGGFDRPILHGLCTLGVAVRAILSYLQEGTEDDPAGMVPALQGPLPEATAIAGRFSNHVFPGDTLVVRFSPDPALRHRVHFEAQVAGREAERPAISGGLLDLSCSVPTPRRSVRLRCRL